MTHLHSDMKDMDARAADIAIIGVSARVPGARDVDALWSLLMSGEDGLSTFAPHEVAAELAQLNDADRARYVARRGVLPGIEEFDAGFFNLSAAEATLLDPQHRVLMELVWEALEDAGAADCTGRNVGVFATSGLSQYLIKHLLSDPAISEQHGQLQLLMLNDKDFLATRIAYFLNVHGPAVNVQTGCSSSLVALHYACLSLLHGDCEMAVVGGVSIALPQQSGYVFAENMIGSRDGFCRAFDRDASGTVRGNGACAVVLKPLAQAVADRDPIWAVIKGTALNNDGRDKVGFTAPSPKWQADVIDAAYRRSGTALDDIDLVEAHGTGTPLGDPIEARALNQVFAQAGTKRTRHLGALKTQLGHLDTAAGLAGLIKLCLALRHGVIPPTAHFRELSPRIAFDDAPFAINTEPVAWPRGARPRCAALSSFGIGGTNAHVVVAEGPAADAAVAAPGPHVIVASAKSATSLSMLRQAYIDALETLDDDAALADFAWSTRVGRKAFEHRLAVCAASRAEALAELRAAHGRFSPKPVSGVAVDAGDAPALATLLGVEPRLGIDGVGARLAAWGIALDAGAAVRLTAADGGLCIVQPGSPPVAVGAGAGRLQAALWRAGVAVDFARATGAGAGRRMRIPTYRFDRQRYWVEPARAPRDAGATGRVAAAGATAGRPASLAALETTLLAQWRTLLGAPALRGTDNVFEHGADSLTVGQFVSQLISEHALPVHVVDCYSQPSVGGQARLLGERIGLDAGAAQRVAAGPRETDVEKFEHL